MIRCLETRKLKIKLPTIIIKWRRYRDDEGTITVTCEVPADLWNKLASMCGETELIVKRSTESDTMIRRDKIIELLDEGWKVEAIASELKISVTTVYDQRKRMQNETR